MKSVSIVALLAPLALSGCLIVSETRESVSPPPPPERVASVAPVDTGRVVNVMRPNLAGANTALNSGEVSAPGGNPSADRRGVTFTRDVIYGHHDGMANVYDVIKPDNANGSAVLYMVSGGWVSRWASPENRVDQFRALLDQGITVIPVHHGSSPRFKVPEAHADVKRALRHVTLNAGAYGIDPKRLGVFGGSAGGHLSLMLGLNGDDGVQEGKDVVDRTPARIKAVVAYYPPSDLRRLAGPSERFPALDFPPDQAAAISPILFADGKDPATLIVHGDADELVNISSGKAMYDALKAAGARTEFIVIKGGDHGFTNAEHRAEAGRAMARWFKENL
jgi:acetyl esterase/lipase